MMRTGAVIRWVDALTAGMLMLALTAFGQSSAYAAIGSSSAEDTSALWLDELYHSPEMLGRIGVGVASDGDHPYAASKGAIAPHFTALGVIAGDTGGVNAPSGLAEAPSFADAFAARDGWLLLVLSHKTGP